MIFKKDFHILGSNRDIQYMYHISHLLTKKAALKNYFMALIWRTWKHIIHLSESGTELPLK